MLFPDFPLNVLSRPGGWDNQGVWIVKRNMPIIRLSQESTEEGCFVLIQVELSFTNLFAEAQIELMPATTIIKENAIRKIRSVVIILEGLGIYLQYKLLSEIQTFAYHHP